MRKSKVIDRMIKEVDEMPSYIVYGDMTLRGYWIVDADIATDAEHMIMSDSPEMTDVGEILYLEVTDVVENV